MCLDVAVGVVDVVVVVVVVILAVKVFQFRCTNRYTRMLVAIGEDVKCSD